MSDKTQEIIDSVKCQLMDKPLSVSEISEKLKINWRTAENYLEILKKLDLVKEINIKNTRTFFYKDKDNYFDLPVKNKDSKLISSIYFKIKKTCLDLYEKEPTKTQVYKIIWKINEELNLGLPVGWYKYGPCCVQVYKGDEKEEVKLDNSQINLIKSITKEYCILDNIQLQKKIYKDAKKDLYKTKEDLLEFNSDDKTDLNMILMDLVKHVPQDTIETTTDFSRATLLLGWNKTKTIFDTFWKYITMVVFKKTLEFYYEDNLEIYLDEKIEEAKKEAQLDITNLVRSNVKPK